MGKFFGMVGYSELVETPTGSGVWVDTITERPYYGDVQRNTKHSDSGEHLNDELNVDNVISIVADAFALQNFFSIKYIDWMGASWKVLKVDAIQRPRLILTIGGVYNGPKPTT